MPVHAEFCIIWHAWHKHLLTFDNVTCYCTVQTEESENRPQRCRLKQDIYFYTNTIAILPTLSIYPKRPTRFFCKKVNLKDWSPDVLFGRDITPSLASFRLLILWYSWHMIIVTNPQYVKLILFNTWTFVNVTSTGTDHNSAGLSEPVLQYILYRFWQFSWNDNMCKWKTWKVSSNTMGGHVVVAV